MNLWHCAHIQLFTASASRSFSPMWDKIYICGWDHYKSFMYHKCNFKCLQAWRTVPMRYQLYFMGYCFIELTKKRALQLVYTRTHFLSLHVWPLKAGRQHEMCNLGNKMLHGSYFTWMPVCHVYFLSLAKTPSQKTCPCPILQVFLVIPITIGQVPQEWV